MQFVARGQHTVLGIGKIVLYNPFAQGLTGAKAQFCALVQGADVLGVLLPKAELPFADVLCHAFGGGAYHGKFKIVDGGGAVEGKMGDITLLRQADKAGPHASAHYMPAHHHQHAGALFARSTHTLRQKVYGIVVVFGLFIWVYHHAQIKVVHALAQGQKPQARAVKLFERHVTVPPFQTKMPPAHPDGGSRE